MRLLTLDQIEEAIGPIDKWAKQCHAASLALARSGLLGADVRVARGWAFEVSVHQHSWIIDGEPYSALTEVLDITAWSYNRLRRQVWYSPNLIHHTPHGHGRLRPTTVPLVGEHVELEGLSPQAETFLRKRFPGGYGQGNLMKLVSGPVLGWPAKSIFDAMERQDMSVLIPVDVLAMVLEGGYK